jgi:hypothetical protein
MNFVSQAISFSTTPATITVSHDKIQSNITLRDYIVPCHITISQLFVVTVLLAL